MLLVKYTKNNSCLAFSPWTLKNVRLSSTPEHKQKFLPALYPLTYTKVFEWLLPLNILFTKVIVCLLALNIHKRSRLPSSSEQTQHFSSALYPWTNTKVLVCLLPLNIHKSSHLHSTLEHRQKFSFAFYPWTNTKVLACHLSQNIHKRSCLPSTPENTQNFSPAFYPWMYVHKVLAYFLPLIPT